MILEKIKPQQAEELADLCQKIYQQVYPYLWDDAGKWYMQTRYNTEQLTTEITHPNVAYYFINDNSQKPVGHLKLILESNVTVGNSSSYGESKTKMYLGDLPDIFNTGKGLELERIYFLSEATGQGFGKATMDLVFEMARQMQKNYVWLHVMDSSPAKKFYERNGFTTCGETILPFELMKPQYRRMFKMWKEI